MKLVELLAPAKDYAAAAAAVDYGADAVYIGGARFGARQAAGNCAEEFARVVEMPTASECGSTPRSTRSCGTTNWRPPNGRPAA